MTHWTGVLDQADAWPHSMNEVGEGCCPKSGQRFVVSCYGNRQWCG